MEEEEPVPYSKPAQATALLNAEWKTACSLETATMGSRLVDPKTINWRPEPWGQGVESPEAP
jgi:hypothetical protein